MTMANFNSSISANSPVFSTFKVCKTFIKVKFGESYFNAKPGMVLQRNDSGVIIRIFSGITYDNLTPDLPYWEENGKGGFERSFMWLDEAPDFVQAVIQDLNDMAENGHIYGVYNPNANPKRKKKVLAMIQEAAGLYSDIPTSLVSKAVSNIKSKDLVFDTAISFEEGEEGFCKIDGVPSISTTLDGNYTEYVTFRSFCRGKIILQSEYNSCELTPTHWRLISRKEYDDELKYYLSHLSPVAEYE